MRRRAFIAGAGAAAAWPAIARAQAAVPRHVGYLANIGRDDPQMELELKAFRDALQTAGWKLDSNLVVDYRVGGIEPATMRGPAAELVALRPEAILAVSSLAVQALLQFNSGIPIVFTAIGDPVSSGIVASLAHPGGNVTGVGQGEVAVFGKELEILKEVAPGVTRAAVLFNPLQAPQPVMLRAVEATGPGLDVTVSGAPVTNGTDIERAIVAFAAQPRGGLVVLPSGITVASRWRIIALAAEYRLPAVYSFRSYIVDGGLVAYGGDPVDQFRLAAGYVDRILKGEKPADLPVQQATKFLLIINLKTAKALGLSVPQSLLIRADEVIE